MKINFRIPVFYNSNGELKKKEDKTYVIQFLPGQTIKKFRICVDGKLTSKVINAFESVKSKKPIFLSAIQEVCDPSRRFDCPSPKKFLTLDKMRRMYAKNIVNAFQRNVLSCETEQHRDNLEMYNLIFIH